MPLPQVRQLSKEGQEIYYRAKVGIITILSISFIFYAAFRGQRIVTQLPATYQTTLAPKNLPFNLFSIKLPPPTYEFPNITICGLTNITCELSTSILNKACSVANVSSNCFSTPTMALSSLSDKLVLYPALMAEERHSLITYSDYQIPVVQNQTTTILIQYAFSRDTSYPRKILKLDLKINVSPAYAMAFYTFPSNSTTAILKYRNFQITYEKTFLPLDMNNWLGEVGGVGAIFFFIYLTATSIAMNALIKNSRYSDSLYAKAANEAFDQFN